MSNGTETSSAGAGGSAALAGAGAALLATGLVHAAASRVPFPPIAVAEAIVRGTPGGLATLSIERLGHLAQPILVIATTAAFLGLSWALGRLLPRSRMTGGVPVAAFILGFPLALIALAAMDPSSVTVERWQYALVLLGALTLSATVTAWRYRALADPSAEVPAEQLPKDAPTGSRRELLRALALGGAGLAVGWSGLGRLLRGRLDPGGSALRVRVSSPAVVPPSHPGFDAIPGLAPSITPNNDFYVIDTALSDPVVNAEDWSLSIGGLVERRFEIAYDELLDLPAVEFVSTLECISNEVGGDLISTAKWTGVPVRTLLERAGVRDGVVEVVATSVDGYSDSIPLDDAMRERTIVVLGMNGMTLSREHGFPARLLVPGLYGMKQPKWLRSIELVDRPFEGYWVERGWSKAAIVKTMSRVDARASDGPRTVVAGVAFAGDRGISAVEVSLDAGTTWSEAELEPPPSPLTWRRWRFDLDAEDAADGRLTVRGIDGEGRVQEQAVAPPHPDGASGYHAVSLG